VGKKGRHNIKKQRKEKKLKQAQSEEKGGEKR